MVQMFNEIKGLIELCPTAAMSMGRVGDANQGKPLQTRLSHFGLAFRIYATHQEAVFVDQVYRLGEEAEWEEGDTNRIYITRKWAQNNHNVSAWWNTNSAKEC